MAPRPTVIVGALDARGVTLATAGGGAERPHLSAVQRFAAGGRPDLDVIAQGYRAQHAPSARGLVLVGLDPPADGWPAVAPAERAAEAARLPTQHLPPAVALAHAIPLLAPGNIRRLTPGASEDESCAVAIVAGWSLDSALMLRRGTTRLILPTAGGQCAFAPTSIADVDLLHFLQDRYGYADYAALGTYRGLLNLYTYLKQVGFAVEPPWAAARLAQAPDPAQAILAAARDPARGCSLCREAVERLALALGAYAGTLALATGARGGVYLGGALIPQIRWALERTWFREGYLRQGPARALLASAPLRLVRSEAALLLGAAVAGLAAGEAGADSGQ